MTLLEIQILIHYHCYTTDYRDGDFTAPAVRNAIEEFRGNLNLLQSVPEEEHDGTMKLLPMYRITERGSAFVEALQKIPLPQQVWIMPEKKK